MNVLMVPALSPPTIFKEREKLRIITKINVGTEYIIESVDSISRDGPDCPYM